MPTSLLPNNHGTFMISHIPCRSIMTSAWLCMQVTDTPGLLDRPDADRNAMELLTLASLQHLPTAAMFVLDLTGDCGTPVHKQWRIRNELKARFPDKPWLDVLSKADLLGDVFAEAALRQEHAAESEPTAAMSPAQAALSDGRSSSAGHSHEANFNDGHQQCMGDGLHQQGEPATGEEWCAVHVAAALPHAMRVSSITSVGLVELKAGMMTILASTSLQPEVREQPCSI